MSKRIVFAVTNDLSFDQRMHRICSALQAEGNEVLLIGRKRKQSIPLKQRNFQQHRIKCWFESGKLFYLEYNLRLLLYLTSVKSDVYGAVDLDAALPMYMHAQRNGKPWTFDAHEYFSELEEVITRPLVHWVWKTVERFIVRRAKHAYTISESYAQQFKAQYGTNFQVIRNVPKKQEHIASKQQPTQPAIIIYQGALNIGRGLEASIMAMHELGGAELHIYGDGPIKPQLEHLIKKEKLTVKVKLMGTRIPEELRTITPKADIGLTLFSENGFHHQHSLANRFFDYIHAGIPQLCMAYPEYHRFNETYKVAHEINTLEPDEIARAIQALLSNPSYYQQLSEATLAAALVHHWEAESERLIYIYRSL